MTSKEYKTSMCCDNKSNSRYYARHPTFDCNVVSSIELGITHGNIVLKVVNSRCLENVKT